MSVPISKPEGPSDTKISPKHNVAALTDFFDLTHDLILLKLISWCKAGMFRKSVIWPLFDSIFNELAKAIYIRLGDWSFLNGDKTNFVEVFKHWLSLKSFTNHELGSPTSIFVSISCGVMVASLPVDQLGVSSNLQGNSFFSHFYRGLLQNILHEVK